MRNDFALRTQLRQICTEALDAHWALIEPLLKDVAFDIIQDKPTWEFDRALRSALDQALETAIERHITTTFASVVDALAQAKVRADLAKRLKARGLGTTLLDAVP